IVAQVKTWRTSTQTRPANVVSIVSAGHLASGSIVTTACTAADTGTTPCSIAGANSLIMQSAATAAGTGANMIVGLQTSGLPMDTSLVGNTNTFGNGQWDCD